MESSNSDDKLALVPAQGNENMAIARGVIDPNNLPVLEVQEQEGTFENISDDGQKKESVQQKQQMILKGKDTADQSIQVMEGRGEKIVTQETADGKRVEYTQEATKKSTEKTAKSQTQQEITEKRKVVGADMRDGTKAAQISLEKSKMLQHQTEEGILLQAAFEKDRIARQQKQGQQESIREQEEIELQAQLSSDGSKEVRGKLRNVQVLSKGTEEGTKVQLTETMVNYGVDEQGEIAVTDNTTYTLEFTLHNYLRKPSSFVSSSDTKQGFKGLLDILSTQKKVPWSLGVRILYKFGLLIFYLINFIYPIIIFIIEREQLAYNLVCGLISLIGLCFELYAVIPDLYRYIKQWKEKRRRLRQDNQALVEANDNDVTEDGSKTEQEKDKVVKKEKVKEEINYVQKSKLVFKEFILQSLGEILIYPSIICNLYGFVNEKGWQFEDTQAIFDFALLVYSVVMDVIYAKIIYLWLLHKIIRSSYKAHDEYEQIVSMSWMKKMDRFLSPFHMMNVYAVMLTVAHWLMLAIIGIRIYADNFAIKKDFTMSEQLPEEPDTGDYKSTPFTRYMIFCGAYLPVASMFMYILVNKYWFLQIYWLIKHQGKNSVVTEKHQRAFIKYHYIKAMPQSVKMMAFLRDPLAYLAVIFLIAPFIAFVVGTSLPEYNISDYALPSTLRVAAGWIGAFFSILFMLSNIQAVIISAVIIIILILVALFCLCAIVQTGNTVKQVYRD